MAAEFINIGKQPQLEKGHGKKILFNSNGFHTWIHGDYSGDKGVMHKHSADQTFYCVEGECTFHFPDGPSRKLTAGMLVHIDAGSLYQLENTGEGYMALLGNRAENGKNPRYPRDRRQGRRQPFGRAGRGPGKGQDEAVSI
jgi:mannose-6-phosphate isomerase-like protein (cupin superfamily)